MVKVVLETPNSSQLQATIYLYLDIYLSIYLEIMLGYCHDPGRIAPIYYLSF